MIFETESISFNILEVLELDLGSMNFYNVGRNFSALTFRVKADTVLQTERSEYHLKDKCVSFIPARLDYKRISKYDKLIVIHFDVLNYRSGDIEFFEPNEPEKLEAYFKEILDCWNKKDTGYRHEASAVLYKILAECYRQNFRKKNEGSKIQNAVDYINKHYTDPNLDIPSVAKQSYMSDVYFRRLFKEEFGTSPRKYIVSLRIQHAAGLISAGYHALKEVSFLSGYTDYKYFSVEFKKHMGVSPSEYYYNYSGRKTAQ